MAPCHMLLQEGPRVCVCQLQVQQSIDSYYLDHFSELKGTQMLLGTITLLLCYYLRDAHNAAQVYSGSNTPDGF